MGLKNKNSFSYMSIGNNKKLYDKMWIKSEPMKSDMLYTFIMVLV